MINNNNTRDFEDYNVFLTAGSSCLSIVGAIIILVTYFTGKPNVKNFTRLLLVYLTVADLCTAVGNLVAAIRYSIVHGVRDYDEHCEENDNTTSHETEYFPLCKAQSFLTTFSNLASFLWTTIIAVHLWSTVVLRTRRTESRSLHILYHVISWLVPCKYYRFINECIHANNINLAVSSGIDIETWQKHKSKFNKLPSFLIDYFRRFLNKDCGRCFAPKFHHQTKMYSSKFNNVIFTLFITKFSMNYINI